MAFDADRYVLACPIDWGAGVTSRFEWYTRVMSSQLGYEQRQSMRLAPRESLEVTLYASGPQRTALDLQFSTRPPADGDGERGLIYVPMWHQQYVFAIDCNAGATLSIPNLEAYGYTLNEAAILFDQQTGAFEACEVTALDTTADTLTLDNAQTWPAGCVVIPLKRARVEDKAKWTKLSSNLSTANVRLSLVDPGSILVDLVGDSPAGFDVYGGFPVIHWEPDSSTDLTVEMERMFFVLDNRTSIPKYTEKSNLGFETTQYAYTFLGASEYFELTNLLRFLRGRTRMAWLPSFMRDLELTADADGVAEIRVTPCGLVGAVPSPERRHICIELLDGTRQYAKIASVAEDSGDEVLTLDTTVTVFVTDDARISFMQSVRLDQDSVEIKHPTDVAGPVGTSLALRTCYEWPERSSFPQAVSQTYDPDAIADYSFDVDVPSEVSGWSDLRVYVASAAWDDWGTVSGNAGTLSPDYIDGETTSVVFSDPLIVGDGANALTITVSNRYAGNCNFLVNLVWTGYAPG